MTQTTKIDEWLADLSARPDVILRASDIIDILLDIRNEQTEDMFLFIIDGDEMTKENNRRKRNGKGRQRKVGRRKNATQGEESAS